MTTYEGTQESIYSPGWVDGRRLLNLPDGQLTNLSSPPVVHAPPFLLPEKRKAAPDVRASVLCRALDELAISYAATVATLGLPTAATYGRRSGDSSATAALQSSMANRLQAMTDVHGSPEYALRWKSWDMLLGAPICALRASGRRTSGSGCTGSVKGWATPTSRDHKDGDCNLEVNPISARLGRQVLISSHAPTGNRGALNPAFSAWLMGYPTEWTVAGWKALTRLRKRSKAASDCCAGTAMQSCRRLRRPSSGLPECNP